MNRDCNRVLSPQEYVEQQLVRAYGEIPCDAPHDVETPFVEGSRCEVELDRFERSREAREACIAAHGAVCSICGFDFGKAYGPHFNGIVQVHHIVPLSVVDSEHDVDPVTDLIPVCPNCHVALHSKPGGVYTPGELRDIMGAVGRTGMA